MRRGTTTTDANGQYSFRVQAGSYQVTVAGGNFCDWESAVCPEEHVGRQQPVSVDGGRYDADRDRELRLSQSAAGGRERRVLDATEYHAGYWRRDGREAEPRLGS